MTQQFVEQLFHQSTTMYREGNYPVSIALLNDCIILQPSASMSYSNRALSHFGLHQLQQSFEDLQKCIKLNHLNYIAYFNLFSLNILSSDQLAAFNSLCLCLSSAYTIASTHSKKIQWIEQSIHYAFNNKESIFLKAILYLEQQQYEKANMLENIEDNKIKIGLYISQLQKLTNRPITTSNIRSNNEQWFILKTDLRISQEEVQSKLERMLNEFNDINRQINQLKKGIMSQAFIGNLGVESFEKIEGQTNCVTVQNSNIQSQQCHSYEQKDQKSCSQSSDNYSIEQKSENFNVSSEITQNTSSILEDQDYKAKVNSYSLYPLQNQKQNVRIYIEKADIQVNFQCEELDKIYLIFHYHSLNKEIVMRTAMAKIKEGLCRWEELLEQIQLAEDPSDLSFTIYNKRYTSFKDDLLGVGRIQLSSCGYLKIPIFDQQNEHIGELQLNVQKV